MNVWKLFAFLLVASLAITSCANDAEDASDVTEGESLETPQITMENDLPGAEPQAAVNPGVPHYICPKNCAGSGGPGAGQCPVCGSEYVHNDAYHKAQGATPPAGATPPTSGEMVPVTPPPTTQEPPQNAKGVWHYTCAKGHPGGAGGAGTCATCGGPLAHNPAYHQ